MRKTGTRARLVRFASGGSLWGGGAERPTPPNGAGWLSFASVVSVVKVKPKVVFLLGLLELGWFVLFWFWFFFGGGGG